MRCCDLKGQYYETFFLWLFHKITFSVPPTKDYFWICSNIHELFVSANEFWTRGSHFTHFTWTLLQKINCWLFYLPNDLPFMFEEIPYLKILIDPSIDTNEFKQFLNSFLAFLFGPGEVVRWRIKGDEYFVTLTLLIHMRGVTLCRCLTGSGRNSATYTNRTVSTHAL
jgi:hypothetical protein